MQPAVSVIMPTYNRAGYLKKSIQSVLDQTFSDFEIIVINNYSIDDTLDVIRAFNDPRIKVINFKNDGIIAKSRNQGILQSAGRYIAFLDDDDLWCPNKLELEVKCLESNPEFDLVYSRALIIDEHDIRNGSLIDPNNAKSGQVFLDLLYENFIPILTVLIKKNVFDAVGLFNEDPLMRAAEDYEFWLRASLKSNFGYIDMSLALYRMHSASVSMAINKPQLRQKTLQNIISSSVIPGNYLAEINSNIERLNADISVFFWRASDKANSKIYAKKYFILNLKKIRLLNAAAGFLLYVIVNFEYPLFDKMVKHIPHIRKSLHI
ncbi:glycosyltransferase [uncultured Methanomethylovorans sp.]|uniref:glycosyltransferase n=1 Tax=uncultured Methanomethylovorans sp. TaxID=183759 RepID=UPI002AA7C630|nr:glycosyltransferase [uncultured Methanomethylovorans sp.]